MHKINVNISHSFFNPIAKGIYHRKFLNLLATNDKFQLSTTCSEDSQFNVDVVVANNQFDFYYCRKLLRHSSEKSPSAASH